MEDRRKKPRQAVPQRFAAVDLVVHGFRAGDPAATEAVRTRVRTILSFRGYGMSREERQDVEQEVMTQVWQAANRPDTDLGPRFWGFVEVVTARRSIDWLRTRRRHGELDPKLVDSGASPLDSAMSSEQKDLSAAVLQHLPEPCRELIHLQIGQEKSYREISALLGKSEGALRVQMHRCVQRAREIVTEMEAQDRQNGTRAEEGS